MAHTESVCPECGARLKKDATMCDLCGVPVGESADLVTDEEPVVAEPESDEVQPVGDVSEASAREVLTGVFCNACGWHNPEGARFCSQCGSRLQEVRRSGAVPVRAVAKGLPTALAVRPAAPPAVSEVVAGTPGARSSRLVGITVASGFLLIVALFLVSMASRSTPPPINTSAPVASTEGATATETHEMAPLPPQIASQVEALEAEIARLSGDEKLAKQNELANLLSGVGRLDRAAVVQEAIAEQTNTAEAWTRAGNLYFDWMETLQGEHKIEVARRTIAAYRRSLELDPDNLDVRTDLGWALQYDPVNAMQSINETNLVLEKDPNHVRANFNRGVFLLQINRLDQAIEQFRKVQRIVGSGAPEYQQAEQAIRAIEELRQQSGT